MGGPFRKAQGHLFERRRDAWRLFLAAAPDSRSRSGVRSASAPPSGRQSERGARR